MNLDGGRAVRHPGGMCDGENIPAVGAGSAEPRCSSLAIDQSFALPATSRGVFSAFATASARDRPVPGLHPGLHHDVAPGRGPALPERKARLLQPRAMPGADIML